MSASPEMVMVLEEETAGLGESATGLFRIGRACTGSLRQVQRVPEVEPVAGRPVCRRAPLATSEGLLELDRIDPAPGPICS